MGLSRYYPAFLDIKNKRCLVVGGGSVAERKVSGLLKAGAALVTVISPAIKNRLEKEKSRGEIKHLKRRFRETDLKGAFIVIAATDSEEENEKISGLAQRLNIPVNVVDRPGLCSFIVPSTVRRGPLAIAVSTSGTSPAMARAIRKEIEKLYGPEFGTYLKKLNKIRSKAISEMKDGSERSRFLKSLASEEALKKLRKKDGSNPVKDAMRLPLKQRSF